MLDLVQNVVIYGGAFVAVLSLVVFVHEFGHFQAARSCGVAVDTFSIGFGKSIAAWRDKQGVQWKIGILPLGGYVKFIDDTNAASAGGEIDYSGEAEKLAARQKGFFHAQPLWKRATVVAAGPIANFIFSILVFAAVLMAIGRDVTNVADLSPRIDAVQADAPAAAAGLKAGDFIRAINAKPISSWGDLQAVVHASPGKPLTLTVARAGDVLTLTATPASVEAMDEAGARSTRGALGIQRNTAAIERVIERFNPIEAIGAGGAEVWRIIASTVGYIGNIFNGRASPEHLAGPIGIMDQSGKILEGSWTSGAPEKTATERLGTAAVALLTWAAMLSVAVGFVNLLPVPILDGGHLLFYAIEGARGKPLSAKAQELGFRAGLAAIGSLFLFATWNDLNRVLAPLFQ